MTGTPPPPRFAWDWALAWTGAFVANLFVPALLYLILAKQMNWLGCSD